MLIDYPEGLLKAEIARRLGVHRSTIGRDIDEITRFLPIYETEENRVCIDRSLYLTTIKLTMFELEALHLAARLFARVMKFPFPHAAAALRKLAAAQGTVSPRLAERMTKTAEEIELFPVTAGVRSGGYRKIVEQLGVAITDSRLITIKHYSRSHQRVRTYEIFPLTIEPHHEGRSVHLLGWQIDANPPQFRTLKIERIREITLHDPHTDLNSSIPVDEIEKRLTRAWSIWSTDQPSIEVVLCFTPAVADRVAETLWHTTQTLDWQDNGSLIWRGSIAEPREMYPWIRGWGPDVEVLAPISLRERHREDFVAGTILYKREDTRSKAQTDV